jgi:hypothetical protein
MTEAAYCEHSQPAHRDQLGKRMEMSQREPKGVQAQNFSNQTKSTMATWAI